MARGVVKILTYGKSPDPHWLLLVKPKVSVSTAAAYGRFTNKSVATKQTIDTVQQHLENNDLKSAFLTSANTFEELLFPDHEELVICKEFFTSREYPTIMTGSGPTMVVLLDKPMEALQLQEEIKAAGHDWLSLITKNMYTGGLTMTKRLQPIRLDAYKPLREVVSETLRQAIQDGVLKPGERLMEIPLAEELGVSRTPIREAIRKLELEGFVVMVPRRGTYVANISLKDITQVFEIRSA